MALLLSLPDECIARVLQRLDLRIQAAAAEACSRLRQVLAAARSAVDAGNLRGQQGRASLRQYLAAHGQHVTSISLSYVGEQDAFASCSNLLEARVGAGDFLNLWRGATGLTRLSLECTKGVQPDPLAKGLAALTSLRRLDLTWGKKVQLPQHFLAGLTGRTHLWTPRGAGLDSSCGTWRT